MNLRRGSAAALTALILVLGCGGEEGTPPKVRGDLTISYVQSGRALGAVLLTISGGEVEAVAAVPSGVEVASSRTAGVTRVVISGDLTSGDLLKVTVPDVNASAVYVLRIDQVADAENFALLDPAAPTFTIRR